jgi:O-antigen/teichoic acid export membrane protein
MIPLAAEPVLSRIFTPAEFGVFEVYVSLVMLIGVVATGRYEMAIVLPRTHNKAINLLGLTLIVTAFISLIIFIGFYLGKEQVLNWIPAEGFDPYLYYVPLGIFIFGINRGFLFWMLRLKTMRIISSSRITESTSKAGSSIVFGMARFSSIGLIWGHLFGLFLSTLVLIIRFLRAERNKFRLFSVGVGRQMARKYAEFPRINVPIALSEMMQISGIIFVFSFFFDNTSVGEFSKALRILLIPLNLIGTSISQVFYQKASGEYAKGIDISQQLRRIVIRLLGWSVLPLFIFILISPWLFRIVLGPQWIIAGEYARLLVIWIFFRFITAPVATIPLIIDRQRPYFLLNLIGNLLMIAAVILPGMYDLGITETLVILSVSQAIFVLFLYFSILKIYRKATSQKKKPGTDKA